MKSLRNRNKIIKMETTTKQTDLEIGLQNIASEAKYPEIVKVAAKLDISQSTVYEYLKGKVAKESRGKAILKELRSLILKRAS